MIILNKYNLYIKKISYSTGLLTTRNLNNKISIPSSKKYPFFIILPMQVISLYLSFAIAEVKNLCIFIPSLPCKC